MPKKPRNHSPKRPAGGKVHAVKRPERGATARGYNYQWQQAREVFLQRHPLCVYCEREGRVTPALVVDHITPHRGDAALFWDVKNWQSLCKRCHDSVKQREERQKNGQTRA